MLCQRLIAQSFRASRFLPRTQPPVRRILSNSHHVRLATTRATARELDLIQRIRMSPKVQEPKITSITDLNTADAKWAALKKIDYIDEDGQARSWEVAERKTTGKAGVDAVAIGNIILHPSKPPSTVLVIQYRPPLDAYTVEWPAGLIDQTETAEEAAIRELKEETGYAGKVLSVSPAIAADPGLTSANMKLVMVEIQLREGDKEPEQKLDDGEHIERVTVPLSELYDKLAAYAKQERVVVAAKLWHFAEGLRFAQDFKYERN